MGFTLPDAWLKPAQTQHFEVWPENWPAISLFLRCQTQWLRCPDGRLSGLHYGNLLGMGALYHGENMRSVVEDVQVIEFTILEEQKQ